MVSVCIPVLNNYSGLEECIRSIQDSDMKVDQIVVIDNGGGIKDNDIPNVTVFKPGFNMGVAASWNWFIDNVEGVKIITNDDIIFNKDTIRLMLEAYNENAIIFPPSLDPNQLNAFSCFLIPQKIINEVGKFDEWISYRYAYFEDNDYHYRMSLLGFAVLPCEGRVSHAGSATLKKFDFNQERSHHERFRLAEKHYIEKWGSTPGTERFRTPFNRQEEK